ncbi:SPO11 [Ecytonucleospora hepatopenaei]|uniref:DNA topoisomerase (ATP-hydrolyzing) n=1 Tax=Ecytonucleospora hepatopenaei TaxID=646526 RepID=A0A1W0E490_9MICR|nr:SPO11 [Ecytonucleospora hepatopenaei]
MLKNTRQELLKCIKNEIKQIIDNAFKYSTPTEDILFLCQVYENIYKYIFITKRAIYYRNVNVFKTQRNVNRLINKYIKKFNCSETDLFIEAGAKGLFKGPCIIKQTDNCIETQFFSCLKKEKSYFSEILKEKQENIQKNFKQECLRTENYHDINIIPKICKNTQIICKAKNVLIVEKESVFNFLKNDENLKDTLIVCGKGFPDRNTLDFLQKIPLNLHKYCLVDLDPYGMHIYKQYNKTIKCKKTLTTNCFFKYKIDKNRCIRLNERERKMLKKIVESGEDDSDANFLLGLDVKVEIEAFLDQPGFINNLFD